MECTFNLEHYSFILETALSNGYAFNGFHNKEKSNNLIIYLRHDLDISIEEAIHMCLLEAKLGVRSTYFVLINSPVYNLLAEDSIELLQYIHSKGHWIGLHIDPSVLTIEEDTGIERQILSLIAFYKARIPIVPVISFHRPGENIIGRNFKTFISTYSSRYFRDIKYISDSRGIWREGCPCDMIKNKVYPNLQVLVHPIWWRLSETESLESRFFKLLGDRIDRLKYYLANNIGPIGQLLKGEFVE